MQQERNYAFIDGQNLHLGTRDAGWEINLARFRIYLAQKYQITIAYYFLGCVSNNNENLYDQIQKAGFVLKFREHNPAMAGVKKGNIDADLVFEMMKNYVDEKEMDKVILVSGDGDYKKVVDYLIEKNRFLKVLFPNKRYSSLYKRLTVQHFDVLSDSHIRIKFEK